MAMTINTLREILNREGITVTSFYELRENRAAREVLEVFGEVPEFNQPYSDNTAEHFKLVSDWEKTLYPVQVIDDSAPDFDGIRYHYLVYAPENWSI